MTNSAIPGPEWVAPFIAKLAETRRVKAACKAAGIHDSTAYKQRKKNKKFADVWDQLVGRLPAEQPEGAAPEAPGPSGRKWQQPFLELLAETSNIKRSAQRLNVPLSTIYDMRSRDRDFAAKWARALYDGYTNLEMEVLGYLRDPDPGYKMDVANALRLLSAHKEAAAREKARRGKRDKEAVLASPNAKIDKMRERKAAAEKLLAEDGVIKPVADDRD